ncbi:MAG: amylo-alpha-1,6-glucosidase [Spirochaetia bacterium]|jgi:predicted glycogen debranching enzyme|nr:amylo-alpha-1,6-glucosidase [Spirochaetia bacterium]
MKLIKKAGVSNQPCLWLDREWLETDGKGGFCSLSVPLCSTRKYHGLIVTPLEGFEGRFVLLSGYEISVTDEQGLIYRLDTTQYPGVFDPAGFVNLEKFENSIFPEWVFRLGHLKITVEIFMADDSASYLTFKMESKKESETVSVSISPVAAYRNSHVLTLENNYLSPSVSETNNSTRISFYDRMPPLYFSFSRKTYFTEKKVWLKNREYFREMERGFDFREDCFMPGTFSFTAKAGEKTILRAGCDDIPESGENYLSEIHDTEKGKREAVKRQFKGDYDTVRTLKQGSRHFLVKNSSSHLSIIAGYPWFGEWGRDTMIALPGLTICCGNPHAALDILKSYSSYIKEGLIPNTLSGTQGFESYNSIDAGLLYIWAAQYLYASGKMVRDFKTFIFPAIEKIITAYLDGKVPGLVINSKGFPEAGDENTQLTWMDAKSRGRPVTPRGGSPVEITALFYNALRFYVELCGDFKKKGFTRATEAADKIEQNFIDSYWLTEGGYLADVLRSDGSRDKSVRPNMLYALAVPYPLLDREKGKKLVEITEKELLTSCGLRTLSPVDSSFCKVYQGSGDERDGCYHQGTVWPWLFGIYTDAAIYSAENGKEKALEIEKHLLNFLDSHINECGIGFVSEVFDGENPVEGKGAFAQAWSSGEIIRALERIKDLKNNS